MSSSISKKAQGQARNIWSAMTVDQQIRVAANGTSFRMCEQYGVDVCRAIDSLAESFATENSFTSQGSP